MSPHIPLHIHMSYSLHSRKLTWKPKKGPKTTTVLLKGDYMGFHVSSLGECKLLVIPCITPQNFPALSPYLAPFRSSDYRSYNPCISSDPAYPESVPGCRPGGGRPPARLERLSVLGSFWLSVQGLGVGFRV